MKSSLPAFVMSSLHEIANLLTEKDHFFLATHVNPDGDGIGSLLALTLALKAQGKTVWPYLDDPIPDFLDWLPGKELIRYELPKGNHWTAIVLDCGEASRVGDESGAWVAGLSEVIVLDHHEISGTLGTRRYVEITFATAAIVFKLLGLMGVSLDQEIATNLYVAIFSDTGGFRYQQTNAETFSMAKKLIEAGVNPAEVAQRLTENFPLSRFCLLKQALSRLELKASGRVALSYLSNDDYLSCQAKKADSDDFATMFRTIRGVEVSALIKEYQPGEVTVSLRSRGRINVAELAARFGGGGHRFAAGFRFKGKIEDLYKLLAKELEAFFL